MSSPEVAFEKVAGRQATDSERQTLYRVRDALGIKTTDEVWTLILVLEYYKALYETIPKKIADAANEAVAAAKAAAEAQAKVAVAEVRRALTAGVLKTVNDTAKGAMVKDIMKWVAIAVLSLSAVVSAVGYWAFSRGAAEGQNRAAKLAEQDRERRAAESSWASTPDGRLAFDLAKAGILHDVVTCSGRGLSTRDGWCFAQGERGRPYHWRLPEFQGSR